MSNKFIKFFSPGYFGSGFLVGLFFPLYLCIYKKATFDEIILTIIDLLNIIK